MCRHSSNAVNLATAVIVALCLAIGAGSGSARAAEVLAQPVVGKAISIPAAAQTYRRDLVRSARLAWGLAAPVATFGAQIHQESGWRPDARSPYAHGLAQFTPATADWIGGIDAGLGAADTGNPAWALRALTRYDRWLWDRVAEAGGDCARMALALRAYNGGLGYIQRETRTGKPCAAFRAEWACKENLDYPQRILGRLEPIYAAAGWGLGVCA